MPKRALKLPTVLLAVLWSISAVAGDDPAPPIDFNRDIRPILSNSCFRCHGPDKNERQAGLRLDSRDGALAELESGVPAIVPGDSEASELLRRVTTLDVDERMPPEESGKSLSAPEVELLREWIGQGAPYANHWSYVKPTRPEVPRPRESVAAFDSWPKNTIDYFVLDRMAIEGLKPSPEADRHALIRRASLDLTGLPPTPKQVDRFVGDQDPLAYEHLIDRLLATSSYGEHWARKWLDLARYADSAGYADDPPRTIWAYRDWVIRALVENKPFDQFTIEQIAGDLLPSPTSDQLIATAFHRNTLTNNEGGTDDEEFRNVAIVDRVNTTMAVWMGTTINCCQCHDHKYDPLSQEEFFRLFAVFNSSQDADRRDESPLIEIWTEDQQRQKETWRAEIAELEKTLTTNTPALAAAQQQWEQQFPNEPQWHVLGPTAVTLKSAASATISDNGAVLVSQVQKSDTYTLELPFDVQDVAEAGTNETPVNPQDDNSGETGTLAALRLETLPHESLPGGGPGHAGGNFVVTRVMASVNRPAGSRQRGRYVRIENTGQGKILSLAEVQVFGGAENLAGNGEAKQSSTAFEGAAARAIDGSTDGNYTANSTTHTKTEDNPWWELDLKSTQDVDRIVVWNRTDGGLHTRLKDFRITLLDEDRQTVWEETVAEAPNPSGEYSLSGARAVNFAAAYADFSQAGFEPKSVLDEKNPNAAGWAIGGEQGRAHTLTLISESPVEVPAGSTLTVTIEQLSSHENHTLGHFRLSATADPRVVEFARTPPPILAALQTDAATRTDAQRSEITKYYLTIAPGLQSGRAQLAGLKKQLAEMKPYTTAPLMRELAEADRRTTNIQHRGNFLAKGPEVTAGLPAIFHPAPEGEVVDRLVLARWLVDENNPLTARVIANRYWEAIFGRGIVVTSEDFGTQGDPPSHAKLLDWLATELVRQEWDMKAFLKTIVTSATYRQSSRVTPESYRKDPDNNFLARGPRFRLSAEMIRDQALFVSGLLSAKMYGPPVNPPQPKLGVRAAFGSTIDWKTSTGEDRYRRGLYTTWRRSNPYPSMATFDAPNREVCILRRARTNTPLQALVTLNDPVYVEAAQALARRIAAEGTTPEEIASRGFRICLARPPAKEELDEIVRLYEQAYERFAHEEEQARQMAEQPLGPLPEGADVAELAAWTVVGNVLLNLDEMLMKR